MGENHEQNSGCLYRFDSIDKRFEKVETMIENVQKQSDSQAELMAKFDSVMEFIIEDRKEQKQINADHVQTLQNININLTSLNRDVESVVKRVDNIESKEEKTTEKGKIDVVSLLTKAVETLITGGIIGAIAYGISQMN